MNEKNKKSAFGMDGGEPAQKIAENFFRVSHKSAPPPPPGHIPPPKGL
jgi:hypothetical protein